MNISEMKKLKAGVLGIFIFGIFSCYLVSQKIEYIENPKPTHQEKNYTRLVKEKEISGDIDNEHFMVQPWSIVVDDDNNIYTFDRMVLKIFKFDKSGKFIKSFGNVGQGPGEYGGRGDQNLLYFSEDGYLYLSSSLNSRILKFDRNGNHITDIKVPTSGYSMEYSRGPFLPLHDKNNNFYLLNYENCSIDVFSIQNIEFKKLYSILTKKNYNRSIVLKVRDKDLRSWQSPFYSINTFYDLIGDQKLTVYLANDSQIRIYKKDQLVKAFDIWPRKALEHYKKKIVMMKEKLRKNDIFIVHMFFEFFIDSDNPDYFYLTGSRRDDEGERKFQIYQFDVEGKLQKVLYTPSPCKVSLKKNNRFYGIYKENIFVFKEVNAN